MTLELAVLRWPVGDPRARAELRRCAEANAKHFGKRLVTVSYGIDGDVDGDIVAAIADAVASALGSAGDELAAEFLNDPVGFTQSLPTEIREAVGRWVGDALHESLDENVKQVVDDAVAQEIENLDIEVDFTVANEQAVAWAQANSGALIADITDEARAAISSAVADGVRYGRPYTATAKVIGDVVGLTEKDAAALMRRRLALLAQDVASDVVEQRMQQAAEKAIARRAKGIARTETIRANSRGKQALWAAAVEAGELPSGMERMWVAGVGDPRTCPLCLSLNGVTARLGESFHLDGRWYEGPPAHDLCRCSEALVAP